MPFYVYKSFWSHKHFWLSRWFLNHSLRHRVNVSHEMHYTDVIMSAMASEITSLMIVYSTVYSGSDKRKHQSSASVAFVGGNSPATGKFFAQRASYVENVPFDDVIMELNADRNENKYFRIPYMYRMTAIVFRWLFSQISYVKKSYA